MEPLGLQLAGIIPSISAVEVFNSHTVEKTMRSHENRKGNATVVNKTKVTNGGQVAKSTLTQTAWCGRIWSTWAMQRKQKTEDEEELKHQLLVDLNQMQTEDIAFWLLKFILEVRRSDGNPYSPESLSNIVAGLNRVLRYSGRVDVDLTKDPLFSNSREVLDAELGRYRSSEQKNSYLIVGSAEENILWKKGLLGDHNPQVLVDTLVYYITYCFGLRGGDHRKLRHYPSQLQLFEPAGSTPFLVYSEDCSEDFPRRNKLVVYMNKENSKRCLVRLYKLYCSLCPASRPGNAFYLRPVCQPLGYIWYESSPIGQNALSRTISRLFQKAGIQGNYTNASLLSHFSSRLSNIGSDDQDLSKTTYKIVTPARNDNIQHSLSDNTPDGPPQKRARLSIENSQQLNADYNMINCEPEILYGEDDNEMSEELEIGEQDQMASEPAENGAHEIEMKMERKVKESKTSESEEEQSADQESDKKKISIVNQHSSETNSNENESLSADSTTPGSFANDPEGKNTENVTIPKRRMTQTSWCTGLWKAWAIARLASTLTCEDEQHELLPAFTAMSPGAMAYWLKKFILEIRKTDGEPYSPDSIYCIFAGLNRSLKLAGRGEIAMLRDPAFTECRDVLDKEISRLQATGKFQRKTSTAIGPVQEDTLWAKGILGDHSPQALVDTLVYYFTFYFGIRGTEHRKLSPSQFQLHESTDGTPYLVYNEDTSAGGSKHSKKSVHYMNFDNPGRCLVRLYKLYISKCPQDRPDNVFYLRPVSRLKHVKDPIWYENSPIGCNMLARTIPRLFDEAGIEGNYTSHSVRNMSELFHPDSIEQLIKTLRSTSSPPNSVKLQSLQKSSPIIVSENPPNSALRPRVFQKTCSTVGSEDWLETACPEKAYHHDPQSKTAHDKPQSRTELKIHNGSPQHPLQNCTMSAHVKSQLPSRLSTLQKTNTALVTAVTISASNFSNSQGFLRSSQTAHEKYVSRSHAPVLATPLINSTPRSTVTPISIVGTKTFETHNKPQVSHETISSPSIPSSRSTPAISLNDVHQSVKSLLEKQGSNLAIPEIAALLRTITPEIATLVKRQASHHGQESSVSASGTNTNIPNAALTVTVNKKVDECGEVTVSTLKRKLESTTTLNSAATKPIEPKIVLSSTGFDISVPGSNTHVQTEPLISTKNQSEDTKEQQRDTGNMSNGDIQLESSSSPIETCSNPEHSIVSEVASPEHTTGANTSLKDGISRFNTSSSLPDWSTSLPDSVATALQHSGPPIIITGGLTINFNFN